MVSLNILNLSSDIATNINNNISNISSLNSRITLDEKNINSNIASICSLNFTEKWNYLIFLIIFYIMVFYI